MTGARGRGALPPIAGRRRLAVAAVLATVAGAALAEPSPGGGNGGGARVVSIGGSITEVVYALGAQDRLVAVDSTSRHPGAARLLANVGYMRLLSAEAILALKPTMILAEADAGPPSSLAQLRAAGASLIMVPDHPSPRGVLQKVTAVARALGIEGRGAELSRRLAREFDDLRDHLPAAGRKPRVLFLLSAGRGAPLAAGRGTSAAGIIGLAGGVNAIKGFDGYKPLSPEAAASAAPDILLVTDRTLRLLGGREALLSRPEIASASTLGGAHLVAMDGSLLLGFGPRTPEAIRRLFAALYPEPGPSASGK